MVVVVVVSTGVTTATSGQPLLEAGPASNGHLSLESPIPSLSESGQPNISGLPGT